MESAPPGGRPPPPHPPKRRPCIPGLVQSPLVIPVRPARRAGFTLLEVLLTLALIGLLAAVLIGGGAQLLRTKPVSVPEVFWQAVQAARKGALQHQREVYLKFVDDREKGKGFDVIDGGETKSFPLPPTAVTPDLTVDLLANQSGGHLQIIAGMVVEADPVKYVTFYPDGTCQSFRLQVIRAGATSTYGIDPWTCAPVLKPVDPNAPTP
jgi:prepilin-type N-terminal cleavage/methylation domain-containing protein